VIRFAYALFLVHIPLGYLLWTRLLGCGSERYPGFRVEEEEFWLGVCLLSVPRNKHYLCISLNLFGTYLFFNM
jgi:hypothetical protein